MNRLKLSEFLSSSGNEFRTVVVERPTWWVGSEAQWDSSSWQR